MTVVLILAGVVAAAIIALETWGRRQPVQSLISRAALRHSLELLRTRGVDGSAFVIHLPESPLALVVEKRVLSGKPVSFIVRSEESSARHRLSPTEGRNDASGVELASESASSTTPAHETREAESIDELIGQLDSAAQSLGSRLFPGAKGQFRGDVLAFNISRETGSEL